MKVKCINAGPLSQSGIAPPLEEGKEYEVLQTQYDSKGNPHYDVGLTSEYNYITSLETGEQLKDGHKIHWCHPSRFTEIQ